MDYIDIMKELEQKKSTHTNFSTFWKYYINKKKKALEIAIETCYFNLINLDDNDINLNSLFFLYLYQRAIQS